MENFYGLGIAPKILPALKSGTFIEAFRAKDHLRDILATIPVWVILNERTALLGAARYACSNSASCSAFVTASIDSPEGIVKLLGRGDG